MKKTNLICIVLLSLVLTTSLPLLANKISIDGDVTLTDQNTTGDYTHIQFDISWDNSWRVSTGPSNWDAAWVFAKWKLHGETDWAHCTLNTSEHTAPAGSVVENPTSDNPQTGVFIYRNANGSGSNNWDGVKLRRNYGTDLVADDATVDVKVFAIEMVYVPEDDFYLGDGNSTYRFHDGNNTSESFQVTSAPITFAQTDGNLWASGEWDSPSGTLQANYPTGYKAFYCMKYEISQGQYVDFLNTLTRTQQNTRTETSVSTDEITNIYVMSNTSSISYRQTITCPSSGNGTTYPITFSASVPNRACNYLNWVDGAAYSDWAGLRPMTELEFEKACRGDQTVVAGEHAWGSTSITAATTINGIENGTETITNSGANCCYDLKTFSGGDGGLGPLRCGIFATGSSTREQSGASYYGIMELSGNLHERPVTLGNDTGRLFTGTNGNGVLDVNGNADVDYWPGTAASGSGFRGAGWYSSATYLLVSSRNYAASGNVYRYKYYGFRAVRTQ